MAKWIELFPAETTTTECGRSRCIGIPKTSSLYVMQLLPMQATPPAEPQFGDSFELHMWHMIVPRGGDGVTAPAWTKQVNHVRLFCLLS